MKPNVSILFLFIALFCSLDSIAQIPTVRNADKIRIKEAIQIRNTVGESIWHGISKAPFVILLVTENYEYLWNHPNPSPDFSFLEKDPITQTEIYYRPTKYPTNFEATFPAVNGVSCVVIGTPETTQSNSSNSWVLTVLHENFHQYQEYQPYHYAELNALNLSNGDTSGMWQLNYPFPYSEKEIEALYYNYVTQLAATVEHLNSPDFDNYYGTYKEARNRFATSLHNNHYKYFSFQLWKEGMARYTEYAYLRALNDYQPSPEFQRLDDFTPFPKMQDTFLNAQLKKLKEWKLSEARRSVFYAVGFAEGLLLEKVAPNWKIHYFNEKFNLENTIK